MRPKHSGLGMNGRALNVAMAVGPDFWKSVLLSDESIVLRHGAVRVDAHDLAEMRGEMTTFGTTDCWPR
jgi:hypothetical protein